MDRSVLFSLRRNPPSENTCGAKHMSNKAHDHVHRLIRSMSRAEKRYFKLYTDRYAQGAQSNHQRLFDAIGAMEEYDEATLLERFHDEAFTHHFAITKRRLYESILRSLDAFHAEASLDARLYRGLHQVKILYDRALYDDAAKLLHGLRKPARQHDRQPVLFAIQEWEQRLAERDNYAHVDQQVLEAFALEREALRNEQEELEGLWDLKSRLFLLLYRKGQARDEHMRDAVQEVLADKRLAGGAQARTAKARFLFHHLHSAAAFATGDLQTCHAHLETNLRALALERDRFQQEPSLVLSVLSNIAFVCAALGRYADALEHLKAFRNAPSVWRMAENEDLDIKLFSTSYSLELDMHVRMGRCDLALALCPAVERGLARYGDRLGPMRSSGFLYQLANVHFLAGHNEVALRWTNRLLDGLRTEDSSDLAVAGRTLYLALLLDVGKKDLLPYALRNTERFLQNRGRMHRFEPVFMSLLRASLRAKDQESQRAAFEAFQVALMPLLDDPLERTVFEHFDAPAWVASKLSGKPMDVFVRERALLPGRAA
jgi:hypothetical protein